jgi:type II secretory pathway pseudopilin PulG
LPIILATKEIRLKIIMRKKTVTLMELIIALSILGIVVLGAMSFDQAARGFLRSSERQTAIVNDATLATDHMAKMGLTAIGDAGLPAIYTAGNVLYMQQDSDGNGRWESAVDQVVNYAQQGNTIVYCSTAACPTPQVLANNVVAAPTGFVINVVAGNYALVQVTTQLGTQQTTIESAIYAPSCSIS